MKGVGLLLRIEGGSDTLSITASDGSLSTSKSVALSVKSAAQQVADLRAQVTAFKSAEVLTAVQAAILNELLDLRGNILDMVRVQGFILAVKVYRHLGILTAAQADLLLGPADILLLSVTRR